GRRGGAADPAHGRGGRDRQDRGRARALSAVLDPRGLAPPAFRRRRGARGLRHPPRAVGLRRACVARTPRARRSRGTRPRAHPPRAGAARAAAQRAAAPLRGVESARREENGRTRMTPWLLKCLLIAGGLGAWFWTQAWIARRPLPQSGIQDRVHDLTAPLNRWLIAHPRHANALLICTSALIDVAAV